MSNRLNPDQWQTAAEKNQQIWFDKQLLSQVSSGWFDADFWQQQDAITGESKGRYTTYFIRTTNSNQTPLDMVLRHYYRGGLISKISKRSFVYTGFEKARAYQELLLLSEMRELGLPVPRPIAAQVKCNSLWFCQSDILIERIAHSQDLFHYLSKQSLSADLWRQVGSTIKQFHQHGVYHSDLNIHNILLDNASKIWLIDFDKCGFKVQQQEWQQANLDRLQRSLLKEQKLNPEFHFSQDCWQQLLAGYQQ